MIFLRNQKLPSQEGEPTAAPRNKPNSSSLQLFKPEVIPDTYNIGTRS
jgi:hypothetical protein